MQSWHESWHEHIQCEYHDLQRNRNPRCTNCMHICLEVIDYAQHTCSNLATEVCDWYRLILAPVLGGTCNVDTVEHAHASHHSPFLLPAPTGLCASSLQLKQNVQPQLQRTSTAASGTRSTTSTALLQFYRQQSKEQITTDVAAARIHGIQTL